VIALVAVTPKGRAAAQRLSAVLPSAKVWEGAAGTAATALADAFGDAAVEHVVAFLAVGAAVRLVAPLLYDKHQDPGLVCIDEDAHWAVAVLGGHRGANELAREVGRALGAQPVVTTASESAGIVALEHIGRSAGLRLEPGPDDASVAKALISGERVLLVCDRPWPLGPLPANLERAPKEEPSVPAVVVTDRTLDRRGGPRAVLRPPTLVLGIGASSRSPDLAGAAERALEGWSPLAVRAVATLDRRSQQAESLGLGPVITFHAEELARVDVPNPSDDVARAVGTPSVAEASALLAAGPGATLVSPKVVTPTATAALARVGARGHVRIIGCGPGDPAQMTCAARDALEECHVVIGLTRYVEQVRPLMHAGQRVEASEIGFETDRAARAVVLARDGWTVGVLGSGDAGVYGLAGPVMELAGEDVDVVVLPGVTAALSAASLLGAPLTHDHCSISLSDLLTPWEVIERRLEAAAAADFVIALYNPRSAGRRWQLGATREILLRHRRASTPVGLVTDAFRPSQRVEISSLGAFDEGQIGMTTVIVVGSSATRVVGGRMVTPRGYVA
jgi:cobalt-precorrin 5A hydrolase / cobalt-factor III methyltransferase / precorrin-3B C17-methyltransferase